MTFLAKIFGTKSDREIKKILPIVNQVNQFYDTLKDKDISYLQSRTKELQAVIISDVESIVNSATTMEEIERADTIMNLDMGIGS